MSARILAVVVCYNPEVSALERAVGAVIEQGCDVLLVDNASDNHAQIASLAQAQAQANILALQFNAGLGAAHNQGLDYAQKNDYRYVLLLDQDSIPLTGMVAALYDAMLAKSAQHRVSAVGANYLNADTGSESFFVRFGWLKFQRSYCVSRDEHGCIPADFLISSGSLIDLENISQLGMMDESLFIDHVDTEWFLRARYRGFRAFGVCDAVMQHGLGESTHQINLAGRQRNVPQHRPFRYYYIFRNSILLYKRAYASGLWKWNDLQRLAMIGVMFGLFKSPRLANLKMMLKGTWHGLLGKTGRLDG